MPPNDVYKLVNEYTGKALLIDKNLSEAYSVLGLINTYYYWDWSKAETYFRRALQLNPNSATNHIYYSYLLTFTKRHEEAIAEAKKAQELDPISEYVNTHLGSAYYYNDQYDKAIEELKSVISLNSDYAEAYLFLSIAYSKSLMFKNAVLACTRAYNLSKGLPIIAASQAAIYQVLKRYDRADEILEELLQRSRTEYIPASSFYVIYNSRGDKDLAYQWLKQAIDDHDSMLPWLNVHPDRLGRPPDEPRFKELLKKAGLK
jgi:tetratricopeptide (TPR) repeat protein